jgi:hypothetical protein
MICEKCIFSSECKGILLQKNRCNFFLKHSDVESSDDENPLNAPSAELKLQNIENYRKN